MQLMERAAETDGEAFGPRFVAAFAQSNEGDTSPNTQGAFCGTSGSCQETRMTLSNLQRSCTDVSWDYSANDPIRSSLLYI